MKYIIANWKMQLPPAEEVVLAQKISELNINTIQVTVGLMPSFLSLWEIANLIKNSPLHLGAQDCFWEDQGAYTGEISAEYLKSIGCRYVLIGHSERRSYLGESETMIHKKLRNIIDNSLIPTLCLGESAEERRSGSKDHIVRRQLELALQNLNLVGTQKLLIAYEPMWAIGTGKPASVPEIVYMHQLIYQTLIDLFPRSIVDNNIFVLYGGSVDSSNAEKFLQERLIDGVLVGSASVKAGEFAKIIQLANQLE